LSPVLFDDNRFRFFTRDAHDLLLELADLEHRPDIVYLDPMFPPKQKSSIAKKEMQWLQQIHAATSLMYPDYHVHSAEDIFSLACAVAKKRVIVKRPLRAECLVPSPQPTFSKSFKSARFDVYQTLAAFS
jgi:16S rRNA (guanine1516-N2)-methyltransferase